MVFGYDEEQPPLLDGVTLSINPASSSPSWDLRERQTTLLRLILGFEEPWSGVVAYDGNDLAGSGRGGGAPPVGDLTQSPTLSDAPSASASVVHWTLRTRSCGGTRERRSGRDRQATPTAGSTPKWANAEHRSPAGSNSV